MALCARSWLCSSTAPRRLVATGVLWGLLIVLVATGCQSTSTSHTLYPESIADQYLPRERQVEAHPDSMRTLTIVERDDKIAFEMEQSYQRMHQSWSSTFDLLSAGRRPARPLTYATLWSKDLSLAALDAREGVSTLTQDAARERIQAERDAYHETVQIDLYWFTGPRQTPPSLLRANAQLRAQNGTREDYRPREVRNLPIRDVLLPSGDRVLYRRVILVFDRMVDDHDILSEINELKLRVTPSGGTRLQFAWSWSDEPGATTATR
ncbi:MAG: hypothetical protein PPP56_08540 [Longimonas sp.]|uniref:hypothetical protein n=1 Tax=Longimonas sp. TaxID=2039626 RepID=UPI00335CE708